MSLHVVMEHDGQPVGSNGNSTPLVDLLVRLKTEGRESDWQALITTRGDQLKTACRKQLADESLLDDAFQESLIDIRNALPSFEPQSEGEACVWLTTIATHAAIDLRHGEQRRWRREDQIRRTLRTAVGPVDDAQPEAIDRVRAAVCRLPESQRRVIELRYFYDFDYPEVARRLGLEVQQARQLAGRAILTLRKRLAAGRPGKRIPTSAVILALLTQPGVFDPPSPPTAGIAVAPSAGLRTWLLWVGGSALGLVGLGGGLTWWMRQVPPAPSVQTQSQDPGAVRSASLAQDMIRRFKERHPDWRLTDYGRRLNDPRLWRVEGGQSQVNAAGTAIELRLANPGDAIRASRLSLVPGFAVDTQPHLLIARVRMRVQLLHAGIRVETAWSPPVGAWEGKRYEMALSDDLLRNFSRGEDAPTVPEYPDGFHIGLQMDREGCEHLVAVDVLPSSPELTAAVQHKTGTLAVELLCRRRPEPQSCVLSEVEVYVAGVP